LVFLIQDLLSIILLYFSIFKPQDYDISNKGAYDYINSEKKSSISYLEEGYLNQKFIARFDKDGKVFQGVEQDEQSQPYFKITITDCKSKTG